MEYFYIFDPSQSGIFHVEEKWKSSANIRILRKDGKLETFCKYHSLTDFNSFRHSMMQLKKVFKNVKKQKEYLSPNFSWRIYKCY